MVRVLWVVPAEVIVPLVVIVWEVVGVIVGLYYYNQCGFIMNWTTTKFKCAMVRK